MVKHPKDTFNKRGKRAERHLTDEILVRRMNVTKKQLNLRNWPTEATEQVWDIDPETNAPVQLHDETWKAIGAASARGHRNLKEKRTLSEFKEQYGLTNHLTTAILDRRIYTTHLMEGVWPDTLMKNVWDMSPVTKKPVILPHENWKAISECCRRGERGLPQLGTMNEYMKKHIEGYKPRPVGRKPKTPG
jgi:hypothetical protein